MPRITRLPLVALLTLVLAACGGNADESASSSAAPTEGSSGAEQSDDPSDGSDAPADQVTAPDSGDIEEFFDTAGGAATVTIGDETWEFELVADVPIAVCDADFFGGFVALLMSAGADMANPMDLMDVKLPGGDFMDPPTLTVNLGASGGLEWIADETIYEQNADLPAGLGVTAFSVDGNTASGTASFFEQESLFQFGAGTGDLVTADGSFTVTCASGE